jgi:hypothetical protein
MTAYSKQWRHFPRTTSQSDQFIGCSVRVRDLKPRMFSLEENPLNSDGVLAQLTVAADVIEQPLTMPTQRNSSLCQAGDCLAPSFRRQVHISFNSIPICAGVYTRYERVHIDRSVFCHQRLLVVLATSTRLPMKPPKHASCRRHYNNHRDWVPNARASWIAPPR